MAGFAGTCPRRYSRKWLDDENEHFWREVSNVSPDSPPSSRCKWVSIVTIIIICFSTIIATIVLAVVLSNRTTSSPETTSTKPDHESTQVTKTTALPKPVRKEYNVVFKTMEKFTPDLANKSSTAFKKKSQEIVDKMDAIYRNSSLKDVYNGTVVNGFRNGSLVVDVIIIIIIIKIPSEPARTTPTSSNFSKATVSAALDSFIVLIKDIIIATNKSNSFGLSLDSIEDIQEITTTTTKLTTPMTSRTVRVTSVIVINTTTTGTISTKKSPFSTLRHDWPSTRSTKEDWPSTETTEHDWPFTRSTKENWPSTESTEHDWPSTRSTKEEWPSTETTEHDWPSTKTTEHDWPSTRSTKEDWPSTESTEHDWPSTKTTEHDWPSTRSTKEDWPSTESTEHDWPSTKTTEHDWPSTRSTKEDWPSTETIEHDWPSTRSPKEKWLSTMKKASTFMPINSSKDKDFGLCTFEDGLCGFLLNKTEYHWSHQKAQKYLKTGPHFDHTIGLSVQQGHYLFAPASNGLPGNVAEFRSAHFHVRLSSTFLFRYYMHGKHMGTLRMWLQQDKKTDRINEWSVRGDQSDRWHLGCVKVPDDFKGLAVFQAIRGSGFQSDMAVDDVLVSKESSCSNFYSCDFEDDYFCNFVITGTRYRWRRKYWWSSLGHALIADSSNVYEGEATVLSSPFFNVTSSRSISFAYNLMAEDDGSLIVEFVTQQADGLVTHEQAWTSLSISKLYNKNNSMQTFVHACVNLPEREQIAVNFISHKYSNGPVILDDIKANKEHCQVGLQYGSCDFEQPEKCDYVIQCPNYADFNWRWDRGRTPTWKSGPQTDHTYGNSSGYYLYTESSASSPGEKAFVHFQHVTTQENGSISFAYFMWGEDMGTLELILKYNNSTHTVWSATGDKGPVWHKGCVNLSDTQRGVVIMFVSTRGEGPLSDMAIDDVGISSSPCISCLPGYFPCGDSCEPNKHYCNGLPDCTDGVDEPENCTCMPGHFRCDSGQCVEAVAVCDGLKNCLDYSDEKYCSVSNCSGRLCTSGMCVASWKWCNGQPDCDDRSDEILCDCLAPKHKCDNGVCVSSEKWCNTVDNCGDNSDEKHCNCTSYQNSCSDGSCIMKEWICDGNKDCSDGTDESNCHKCRADQFICTNQYICLNESQVCDSHPDCPDEQDEANCTAFEKQNSESIGILKINQNGKWMLVCSDNWSSDSGNSLCQSLGRRSASSAVFIDAPANTTTFLTVANSTSSSPTSSYIVTGICNSGKIVSLSCEANVCGISSRDTAVHNLDHYVIGGSIVDKGVWPWMVSLHYLGTHICGGALISDQWIISAAHCFQYRMNRTLIPHYYKVILGETDLKQGYRNGLRIGIKKFVLPPNMTFSIHGIQQPDVVLMQLKTKVNFTSNIQPLCLYSKDFSLMSTCYLAGWGSTVRIVDSIRASDQLHEVRMILRNSTTCETMQQFYFGYHNLCAMYANSDISACKGDSGSPLVCRKNNGQWFLAGIASFAQPRCAGRHPNGFARVSQLFDWIQQTIRGPDN